MNKEYFVGHDAMPKLGRVKTGQTARSRSIPKLDLDPLQSSEYTTESVTETEYSGMPQNGSKWSHVRLDAFGQTVKILKIRYNLL